MSINRFNKSIAVVIGIDRYQQRVPALQTPVRDAEAIAHILQEKHGYQVYLCLDEQANKAAILELLQKELPDLVEPDDRLIFYFAGHGVVVEGDTGPEGYLLPQDAVHKQIESYLSMQGLHDALIELKCRHFLGFLDCCFAASFKWAGTRKAVYDSSEVLHRERFDRFVRDPAWQVITSSSYDQEAFDTFVPRDPCGEYVQHSPFAAALIDALKGKADAFPVARTGIPAGDGVITANELYLYLRDRVETATESYAFRQTPGIHFLNKHDKGEYIFLTEKYDWNQLPQAAEFEKVQNPYLGLKPFDEKHKDLFFGRSKQVKALLNAVKQQPMTIVLGPSGSGKSSLVKAGLFPAVRSLEGESWMTLPPFSPGDRPIEALNKALNVLNLPAVNLEDSGQSLSHSIDSWRNNYPQASLLIFVDQCEELFTFCADEYQRQAFCAQILTAIKQHGNHVRVVLALRQDFEPHIRDVGLSLLPKVFTFMNCMNKHHYWWQKGRFVVPPLRRSELREAIKKPAEAFVRFESTKLVENLIEEVVDMPGALPLLSWSLNEMFGNYLKRRQEAGGKIIDRAITQDDYPCNCRAARKLNRKAEREYNALIRKDPVYEQTICNVMLRMVTVGEQLHRRQALETELIYPEPENRRVRQVIDRFLAAHLLVTGKDGENRTYFEPAHDSLVSGWSRLGEWLEQKRKELVLRQVLSLKAAYWDSQRETVLEPSDKFHTPERVNVVLNHLEGTGELLWNEDSFLDALEQTLHAGDSWFNKMETDAIMRRLSQRKSAANPYIRTNTRSNRCFLWPAQNNDSLTRA